MRPVCNRLSLPVQTPPNTLTIIDSLAALVAACCILRTLYYFGEGGYFLAREGNQAARMNRRLGITL